jgi:hypothetical protein
MPEEGNSSEDKVEIELREPGKLTILTASAANPLYVQAITTLLPSPGRSDEETAAQRRKATPEDICQGESELV